jgi:hypothetical protein
MKIKPNSYKFQFAQGADEVRAALNAFNDNKGPMKERVSARYAHVPTRAVVAALEQHGWTPSQFRSSGVRNLERVGFQPHQVRLRHSTGLTIGKDGLIPEIILRTAFDGTSAFNVSFGFYRMVCSNGLMVGETVGTESVRHVGNAAELVGAAVRRIQERVEPAYQLVAKMRETKASDENIEQLLKQAHELLSVERASMGLLTPTRAADRIDSLWSVFNVIQERGERGQYSVLATREDGTEYAHRARPIKSIQRLHEFNKGLFDAAAQLIAA